MATKKKKKVVAKKPQTKAQQIASIKKQAQSIQSSLNKSVASGQIKSGSSKTPTKSKAQLQKELTATQKLAQTTAQKAQAQGKDTTAINQEIARSQALQAQDQAQPNTPFAGSTQEQQFLQQNPTYTPPTPTTDTTVPTDTTQQDTQQTMQDQTQTGQQQTDTQAVTTQVGQQQGLTGSQGGQVQQGNISTPSIVDYLASTGQPTDFNTRKALAGQYGINGYTGSAQQNNQLLSALRGIPMTSQEQVTPTSAGAITQTTQQAPMGNGALQSLATAQQKYGITSTQNDFMSDPLKTIGDITKQVFKAMGVDQANSEITKVSKELEKLQNQKDDEIRAINDDPWLTEGVRQRQVQKAEEKWADRMDSRVNTLQLLENVRNDAQQQAQFALGTAISIYDSERKFQADQIQQYYNQSQQEFDNMIKLQSLNSGSSGTSEMQEYTFAVQQGFSGNFLDYKQAIAAAGRAPSSGGGGGLTSSQINSTINSIAGAFDNEPIVKQFNVLNEGYQFAKNLNNNTTNPADDQGLIYAFAKAMDPNSVVREGEYATVQKYAQSWAKAYGGSINQAISGTGFLSSAARQNIKDTIKTRYETSKTNYDNVYSQYQRRIQDAQSGGYNTLTDYSQSYNQPTTYRPVQPAPATQVFDQVVSQPQSGGFFSNFLSGLFGK